MSYHSIIVEFLGIPTRYTGLLEEFFNEVRGEIAAISDFEIDQKDVFCFPRYAPTQDGKVRIFARYSATSSALLDLAWRSHAHSRIAKMVQNKFQAESVLRIE